MPVDGEVASARATAMVGMLCVCDQLFIIPLHIDPKDCGSGCSRRAPYLSPIPSPTGTLPLSQSHPTLVTTLRRQKYFTVL